MFNTIKNDPVLKAVTIIILVIIVLGLLFLLFGSPFNRPYGMMDGYNNGSMMGGYNGNDMMGGYNGSMMGGYGSNGWNLAGTLSVLVNILLVVSVIGLIVGLAVLFYQKFLKGELQKPEARSNTACSSCKTVLKAEWKCCPVCGTEIKPKEKVNT